MRWRRRAAGGMQVRFGLGTDGTRSDGFRLMDAAEATQRLAFGLANGDSSCGGGWLWLDHATRRGAEAVGLGAHHRRIAPGWRPTSCCSTSTCPSWCRGGT